jgi:type IX secretion system PorP/SprF family membrane protein
VKSRFKQYLLAKILIFGYITIVNAQDPTYSQYNLNQLYYNPAYTGYHYGYQITATYRTLWPNVRGKKFPGPFSTYHAWFDGFVNIKNVFHAGIGAFAMQDVEGEGHLTTSSIGISYAQHLPKIGFKTDQNPRIKISLGFKAYFNSIYIDWDKLVFTDQLNLDYGIQGNSAFGREGTFRRNFFDFDAGLLLLNNFMGRDKWYNEFGFAMAHILAPSISLSGSTEDRTRLPRKYVVSYRSTVGIAKGKLFAGPTILFENQKNFFELNTGLDFFIKPNANKPVIPLNISVMNRLSIIQNKINTSAIIIGLTHKGKLGTRDDSPIYTIGFAVDLPYMGLGMQTAGAYEISVGVIIPRRGSKAIPCPFGAFDHNQSVNRVYRKNGTNR